jgi:hypothetical protein
MMVATLIMGITVVGLMAAISTSLRNASRVTERDRAVLLARSKMDELLLDPNLPRSGVFEGAFATVLTGGLQGGWRVRVAPFEMPPSPAPGEQALDRLELEIWWISGEQRHTFGLQAYRPRVLRPEDIAALEL